MSLVSIIKWRAAGAALLLFAVLPSHAKTPVTSPPEAMKAVVDAAVRPVMARYGIPGMAVGLTVGGNAYVFNYGVASKETRAPVTDATLFEVGSVSKTFTATLASLACVNRRLTLSDTPAKFLPRLRGTAFGDIPVLHLGTHTPGGFPLQVPDEVVDEAGLMAYLTQWKPSHPPGTVRTYSNVSIGMLGLLAAKSMGRDFTDLMEGRLFPALGLRSTYIRVPAARRAQYAQGYTTTDEPARMSEGVLSAEAYGVKTTASDMLRFVRENLNVLPLDDKLQRAVMNTHTGYFRAGAMAQDLVWEQYDYPVTLGALLAGNSQKMAYEPVPVTRIRPAERPRGDVWINKTGSTNGFGAYVAFVPEQRLGIVLLANKNYPNDARIAIAHQILTRLDTGGGAPALPSPSPSS